MHTVEPLVLEPISFEVKIAIEKLKRYKEPGKGKVKVKLSLCLTEHHAMKAYWGSGGIAPLILDLGTRWR
jgi:hypothetical protein